jgi:hypothetical protein
MMEIDLRPAEDPTRVYLCGYAYDYHCAARAVEVLKLEQDVDAVLGRPVRHSTLAVSALYNKLQARATATQEGDKSVETLHLRTEGTLLLTAVRVAATRVQQTRVACHDVTTGPANDAEVEFSRLAAALGAIESHVQEAREQFS